MNFTEEMKKAATAYGISLQEKQLEQFARYYALLIEWNEKMNLTAITDPHDVAIKHMIDSLAAYTTGLFTNGASVIDVGTGAGFPGLPLKIAYPHIRLTLMDSLNKRVRFLQTVVDELGLQGVECVHARAEEGARDPRYREAFDLAVSRAVARLPILAEYCLPFVKVGGYFLALKGRDFEAEMEEAGKAAKILGGKAPKPHRVTLPELDDVRAVVIIEKFTKTGKSYPRKAGMPAKKPLV